MDSRQQQALNIQEPAAASTNAVDLALADLRLTASDLPLGIAICEKVRHISESLTKAGMTEEMILANIACVKNIVESSSVEAINALFEKIKENEYACQTRIGAGYATVATGSIFSASLTGGLVAFSVATLPIAAAAGIGIFAACTATGIKVAADASDKRGELGLLQLELVNSVMARFWNEGKYRNYINAAIKQITIEANYRNLNHMRSAILNACITNINSHKDKDLFRISQELFTTYENLKGNDAASTTACSLANLMNQLSHLLLVNGQYQSYSIVACQLIMIAATQRHQNEARDKDLIDLIESLSTMQTANDLATLSNLIKEKADVLEQRTWSGSDTAIELRSLVTKQLYHYLIKNIGALDVDESFPLSQALLNIHENLKHNALTILTTDKLIALMQKLKARLSSDENQVRLFAIISVQICMMTAKERSQNPSRDNALNALITRLSDKNTDTDKPGVNKLIKKTIEKLRENTWMGTSQAATELEVLNKEISPDTPLLRL